MRMRNSILCEDLGTAEFREICTLTAVSFGIFKSSVTMLLNLSTCQKILCRIVFHRWLSQITLFCIMFPSCTLAYMCMQCMFLCVGAQAFVL